MSECFVVPPTARSWVDVPPESHFPIQNLPFGLACTEADTEVMVVRIGDFAIDLCELSVAGAIPESEFPILPQLYRPGYNRLPQTEAPLLRVCFSMTIRF